MATVEDIQRVLERVACDFRVDGLPEYSEGFATNSNLRVIDAGLDSLDLIELTMAVEDELEIHISDDLVEVNDYTLIKDLPHLLFNAIV